MKMPVKGIALLPGQSAGDWTWQLEAAADLLPSPAPAHEVVKAELSRPILFFLGPKPP